MMKRRHFIKALGASLVVFQGNALSKAINPLRPKSQIQNKKIVWVILRGALDSLHTIVPTSDTNLASLRPKLYNAIKDDLLPLDGGFALHPSLTNLHVWYKNKELSPVIAVGSGYAKRSHFDGQDYLESGLNTIDQDSGWLSRAIEVKNRKGLAVAQALPISLRGSAQSSTWYPSSLKSVDDNIYDDLAKLYEEDPILLSKLNEGLRVKGMVGLEKTKIRRGKFTDLTKSCAKLLNGNSNIDCAMLELGGWDTHNNQHNRLNRQLNDLDDGLQALKQELGKNWDDTVVVVATEFGRTVKENGTGGTDHGTASVMFIAGGNVDGGKVLGEWPGLGTAQLHEGRDLKATSSTFSWISEVLESHWQLSRHELSKVFPV
jgi:uncharacterized protein (DUF1501 family)